MDAGEPPDALRREGVSHFHYVSWAAGCERIIVLSETQIARAEELLALDPERCVLVPNGYDPVAFRLVQIKKLSAK